MMDLKANQIIQTRNGKCYILKHVVEKYGGILAVDEDGYEFFIKFNEFKIILDPDTEEGGI